jgi:hypothetical protein
MSNAYNSTAPNDAPVFPNKAPKDRPLVITTTGMRYGSAQSDQSPSSQSPVYPATPPSPSSVATGLSLQQTTKDRTNDLVDGNPTVKTPLLKPRDIAAIATTTSTASTASGSSSAVTTDSLRDLVASRDRAQSVPSSAVTSIAPNAPATHTAPLPSSLDSKTGTPNSSIAIAVTTPTTDEKVTAEEAEFLTVFKQAGAEFKDTAITKTADLDSNTKVIVSVAGREHHIKVDGNISIKAEEFEIYTNKKLTRLVVVHIVAFGCAALSLPLYFDGNSDVDISALLSSVVSNFIINYYSGVMAGMTDFSKFSKARAIVSAALAVVVTGAYFAAEYYLGSGVIWKAVAEYVGNLGLNAFGLLSSDPIEFLSILFMPLIAAGNGLIELCRKCCGRSLSVEQQQALEAARTAFIEGITDLRSTIPLGTRIRVSHLAQGPGSDGVKTTAEQKEEREREETVRRLVKQLVAIAQHLPAVKREKSTAWDSWMIANLDNLLKESLGYATAWAVFISSVSVGCISSKAVNDWEIRNMSDADIAGQLAVTPLYMLSFRAGYSFGRNVYNSSLGRFFKYMLKEVQEQSIASRLHGVHDIYLTIFSYLISSRSFNTALGMLQKFCPPQIVDAITKWITEYLTIVFNGYWNRAALGELSNWYDSRSDDPRTRWSIKTDNFLQTIKDDIQKADKKVWRGVVSQLATEKMMSVEEIKCEMIARFSAKEVNAVPSTTGVPSAVPAAIVVQVAGAVSAATDTKAGVVPTAAANTPSKHVAVSSSSEGSAVAQTALALNKFVDKRQAKNLAKLGLLGARTATSHADNCIELDSSAAKNQGYQRLDSDVSQQSGSWCSTIANCVRSLCYRPS